MASINLLEQNLGIQNILESPASQHMPQARPLAASILKDAGLDELYNSSRAEKALDAALCPTVGDGTLLQPEVFHQQLAGSLAALQDCKEPAVRVFVRDELNPLLENTELLKTYTGLMIGG